MSGIRTESVRLFRPAVLLDLDGTLVDTLPDIAAAANAFLAENGKSVLDLPRVQAMVGDGLPALAGKVMAAGGIHPVNQAEIANCAIRFLEIYEARHHRDSILYPDVEQTLARLRQEGRRLAICTNKPEAMAADLLDRLGIGKLFDTIGGSDSFDARKPDPAHIRGVLNRLNAPAAAAVMVGDSVNDVLAANRAGMPCIAVAYGYGFQGALAAGPHTIISRFAELPAALLALAAATDA